MGKESIRIANKQDKFRDRLRAQLEANESLFWERLAQLPPKDFVDAYVKVLPFAYAKVPEPKTTADRAALVIEDRVRTVKAIQQGLPEENAEYEEED